MSKTKRDRNYVLFTLLGVVVVALILTTFLA